MLDHNGIDDLEPNAQPLSRPSLSKPDKTATMTEKERQALPPAPPVPPRWFDPASGVWTERRPKSRRIASNADGTPWTFALKAGEGGPRTPQKEPIGGPEEWYRAIFQD